MEDIYLETILDDDSKVLGEIYVITNTINNKRYVGQTLTHRLNHRKYRPFGIYGRFKDHISEALCNTKAKQCTYLNNAIRKNGKGAFVVELVERCVKENLNEREIYYISEFNTLFPDGYNLTPGGKVVSQANFKNTSDNKGFAKQSRSHPKTDETKKLISSRLKERFITNPELKEQRRIHAQQQHQQQRLRKFGNVALDDDLNKYIHPVINKTTQQVHIYKVIVNGVATRFYVNQLSQNEVQKQALEFLQTLKNNMKSLAT